MILMPLEHMQQKQHMFIYCIQFHMHNVEDHCLAYNDITKVKGQLFGDFNLKNTNCLPFLFAQTNSQARHMGIGLC